MDSARLTYFKGRGRAESTRWMLAAAGVPFETVALETAEEFARLRASGKLLFNQLPLLEIDRLCLTQTPAMTRYLARRSGLYGRDDLDRVRIDMIAGAATDMAEAAITFAFQPTADAGIDRLRPMVAKYAPRFDTILAANGGTWMVGATMTMADVMLAEVLSAYLERWRAAFDAFPALAGLHARVTADPRLVAYLGSSNRWPPPGDSYVIDVARVLQRALPPHMPDRDRFVIA